jgi:signal transduction histidine kinase
MSSSQSRHILLGQPGRLLRLAALGIVAFAIVSALIAASGYRTQVDAVVQEAALRARGAAADVERYLQARFTALEPIAATRAVREGDVDAIEEYLDGLDVDALGFDGGIGWIDAQGVSRARSGNVGGLPLDVSDRPHVRGALDTGLPTVSRAFEGSFNDVPVVTFSVPVIGDDGRVTGLVGGGVRLDQAGIRADSLRFAGGTEVVILDGNGTVLADTEPVTTLHGADPDFPRESLARAGEGTAIATVGPNSDPDRLVGFASAPTAEWLVLVDRSASAAFWPARATLAFQLSVIALGTAIAVTLLLWSGRRLDDAAEAERRTLAQLEEAIGRLEHRQALHDAFVGVMSHELRTPVTTIYGAIKLLVKHPRRPEYESLLEDIEEEADRLQRITEDLLVLSRAEHGVVEVRPEPVLLQRIATGVVADVSRRFGGAPIATEMPIDLPPLSADPGALRQVLDNLLANAAKYGGGSPIRLVAAEEDGTWVRVEVADAGPGLPAGEHDRIFELFYRSPANERRASGTGIGLFVVRQLVDAMGGTVVAQPVEPTGVRFVLRLPVDPAHVAEAAPEPVRNLEVARAG